MSFDQVLQMFLFILWSEVVYHNHDTRLFNDCYSKIAKDRKCQQLWAEIVYQLKIVVAGIFQS
jgi:hypothetical protein